VRSYHYAASQLGLNELPLGELRLAGFEHTENPSEADCFVVPCDIRYLSDKQLANGTARGIVTHVQVSKVFKKSTHWDPGPGFPKDLFLIWVQNYLAEIKSKRDR